MIQNLTIFWVTLGVLGVILFVASMIVDYRKTNILYSARAYTVVSIIILAAGPFGFVFGVIGAISMIMDQTDSSI